MLDRADSHLAIAKSNPPSLTIGHSQKPGGRHNGRMGESGKPSGSRPQVGEAASAGEQVEAKADQ